MGNKSSKSKSNRTTNNAFVSEHSFGSHGSYIRLSGHHNETMTVRKPSNEKFNFHYHCVYGSKSHPSTSSFVHYKIKINAKFGNIGIGLITDGSIKEDDFKELDVKQGSFYSYSSNGVSHTNNPSKHCSKITKNLQQFGKGDIIHVSINRGTITFEPILEDMGFDDNRSDSGCDNMVIFKDIAQGDDIKYRLVISAERNGDSVTIINDETPY